MPKNPSKSEAVPKSLHPLLMPEKVFLNLHGMLYAAARCPGGFLTVAACAVAHAKLIRLYFPY